MQKANHVPMWDVHFALGFSNQSATCETSRPISPRIWPRERARIALSGD
jgi:hypothetical protein